MNGFEKQILLSQIRLSARQGKMHTYLFRFTLHVAGKQWRIFGLRVNEWHWFKCCADAFPEGDVYRFWLAKFMLKIRVNTL